MEKMLKRFLIIIVMLFLTLSLVGCTNKVVPNENSITLTLNSDYASVIDGEIPSFTFNFNGNLNTIEDYKNLNVAVFSDNEDIILSDALAELFKKYKDRMYVSLKSQQVVDYVLFSTLDDNGKVKNKKLVPDDKKVFIETAYISLENGLKLTVDYARFLYNGKTYYTWSTMYSITMYLYYPVMAIEDDLTNKLVLITLPNRVTFAVGPSLKLSNVLNGVSYIQDEDCMYYTFKYIEGVDEEGEPYSLEQKQQYVIDYYVNEMNGECSNFEEIIIDKKTKEEEIVIRKQIKFTYLNNDFIVKLYDNNFKMEYVRPNVSEENN